MIRILIVDDHQLIREGFKKVIGDEVDMKVVAECQNAAAAAEFLRDQECDVMALDINLPGKNGLDFLKELPLREMGIKVLVLSVNPEERFAIRALQSGASGYITKDTAADELAEAIRKVYFGGRYVSKSLAEQLAVYVQHDSQSPLHTHLSDREFEIMQLIASGRTLENIAEHLSLSTSSVKTYRHRILEKLNLKSNAEIIRYALMNKLID